MRQLNYHLNRHRMAYPLGAWGFEANELFYQEHAIYFTERGFLTLDNLFYISEYYEDSNS